MQKIFFSLYILSFFFNNCLGKENLKTQNAEQVLNLVRDFHPISRQAVIEIEKSKADILLAKSAFDPILSNYIAKKTFDGTNYYRISSPEIRIPTWYGVEVVSGVESLSGNRFDVSETTGKTSYFGLRVPLAKNLVLDKRRAFLQQSKIMNKMAVEEQRLAINNLLMEAMDAYWQWVNYYQKFTVIKNNVTINEKRLELVKKSFDNGERAAIEVVEAEAQLQSFQYLQNNAWVAFQNSALELSAYLWQNNNEFYTLPETVIPQDGWENEINIANFNLELENLESTAAKNHPYLQIYNYKLETLEIDKKLKFQDLLPKIDFQYNQLGKGYKLLKTAVQAPLFENNFQYGFKFEMPLRLSQGRSDFQKAKLKIEETKLDQNQKNQQILIKVKSYFNEYLYLKNQTTLQSSNYENYQKLVTAEETKLFNGESTLFLVNSRENKALEALEKLIELKTKYYKTIYALQWSAGILM